MSNLFGIIENHINIILGASRSNVLFFDSKRNELFRRKNVNGVDTLESNIITLLGFKVTDSIAGASIQSLSVVTSKVGYNDKLFCKEVDDPKGTANNPALNIVAIPILPKIESNGQTFCVPKGVVVAVNRVDEGEFRLEDIENIQSYNFLVSKIIDITA